MNPHFWTTSLPQTYWLTLQTSGLPMALTVLPMALTEVLP
jgi:hypothetical protein